MSTSNDENDSDSCPEQEGMESTFATKDVMSEPVSILERESSLPIKVEERRFSENHDMDVQIDLGAGLPSSSTLQDSGCLSPEDNLDINTTPKRQDLDDQIERKEPSFGFVLDDSPPWFFRGSIDLQFGWQGHRVESLLNYTALASTSEDNSTSLDRTEAADKLPEHRQRALDTDIENLQICHTEHAVHIDLEEEEEEEEEKPNEKEELGGQEALETDTGPQQACRELSIDNIDLIKVPKQKIDEEHQNVTVIVVETEHEITRKFDVGGKDGRREESVARLRESANHRTLTGTLPEPHQPHPSTKIPPTLYEEAFRTHQNKIHKPASKACSCTRSHIRLGGDQAHKFEHAEEAMSRSSPGEPKHTRLQSIIDLSDNPADYQEEGQKGEILAEDIPTTVSARHLKSSDGKRLKPRNDHIGAPKSPREEGRTHAPGDALESRKKIKSSVSTKEEDTAIWVAYQRYLDPKQDSLPNYDPPNQKVGAAPPTMAPLPGSQFAGRPINRLGTSPHNPPYKPQTPSLKSSDRLFNLHEDRNRRDVHVTKKRKTGQTNGEIGRSSNSAINLDPDVSNRGDRRVSSTIQSSYSQSQSGRGKSSNGGLGHSSQADLFDMMNPTPVRQRNRKKSQSSEGRSSRDHPSSKFVAPKPPTAAGLEELEDPNDRVEDEPDEEPTKIEVSKQVMRPLEAVVVVPRMAQQISATGYQGSAHRGPARPRAGGAVSRTSTNGNKEGPKVSPHFLEGPNHPRSGTQPIGKTGTKRTSTHTIDDEDDDSTLDPLSIAERKLEDSKHRKQAEDLIKSNKHKISATAHKIRGSNGSAIPVDLSDDDDELGHNKADMTETHWGPKASDKMKKLPGEHDFDVVQIFSDVTKWKISRRKNLWLLRESGGVLTFYDGKQEPVLGLTFPLNKLNRILGAEDSPKLILHKTRDNDANKAVLLCLELRSPEQCKVFKDVARDIRWIAKDSDHLDAVFLNKLSQPEFVAPRPAVDERTELDFLQKRSDDQHEEKRRKAQEPKKNSALGTRMKDRMSNSDEVANAPAEQLPRSTRKHPNTEFDNHSSSRRSSMEIPVETFYTQLKTTPQATRSSARAQVSIFKRQTPRPRTPSPILEEWTKEHPMWAENWHSSIIYPPDGKNKATVDKQDIERLNEGEFLNDNLIIFYLRYLEHQLEQKNPELAKRVYFFNTFFYSKLTNPEKGSKGINYEAVKRWTNKISLLSYDYIIVPVNENAHWYVAIICNAPKLLPNTEAVEGKPVKSDDINLDHAIETTPALPVIRSVTDLRKMTLDDKRNESGDLHSDPLNLEAKGQPQEDGIVPSSPPEHNSEPPPITSDILDQSPSQLPKKARRKSGPVRKYDPKAPRIMTLDSLGGPHSATCTNLKKYLLQEIQTRLTIDIPDPGSLGMTVKGIPTQNNYCDCGLFLLSYIQTLLEKPSLIESLLQHEDVDPKLFRKASDMRTDIRNLLFTLQADQVEAEAAKPPKVKRKKDTKSPAKVESTTNSRPPSREAAPNAQTLLGQPNPEKITTKHKPPSTEDIPEESDKQKVPDVNNAQRLTATEKNGQSIVSSIFAKATLKMSSFMKSTKSEPQAVPSAPIEFRRVIDKSPKAPEQPQAEASVSRTWPLKLNKKELVDRTPWLDHDAEKGVSVSRSSEVPESPEHAQHSIDLNGNASHEQQWVSPSPSPSHQSNLGFANGESPKVHRTLPSTYTRQEHTREGLDHDDSVDMINPYKDFKSDGRNVTKEDLSDTMLLDLNSSPISGSVPDADPPFLGSTSGEEDLNNISLPAQQLHHVKPQNAPHIDLTGDSPTKGLKRKRTSVASSDVLARTSLDASDSAVIGSRKKQAKEVKHTRV